MIYWWEWCRQREATDAEQLVVADKLLHSAELAGYWRRVGSEFESIPVRNWENAESWLMGAFLVPAERGLHLGGTRDSPTWKTRMRDAHARDRQRAARIAADLRHALAELAGWELAVRPDELGAGRDRRLERLADVLEAFSKTDALAEVPELAGRKASWRDYVVAVRSNIDDFDGAYSVQVQPTVDEWRAIIKLLSGQDALPLDISRALTR